MFDEENRDNLNSMPSHDSHISSSIVEVKNYRGEAKGLKEKKGPKVLEWDRFNRPIGEWKTSFVNSVGKKVHSNVDINIRLWKNVPQHIKEKMWLELKTVFNIDESKKSLVLKKIRLQFKDWKAKLVSGYITFTRKMPENPKAPHELYASVTKEQWEKFVAEHITDEFKEISEKARTSQAYNKHPHYLGAKSYAQKEIEWTSEGKYPLASKEDENATQNSIVDRSWSWMLGRQRKNDKGEWEYPTKETEEVVQRIEKVREDVVEGKFIPNRQDDILSRGLERKDRCGHVSGIGTTVGHRDYFGWPKQICTRSDSYEVFSQNLEHKREDFERKLRAKVRAETIAELKQVMENEVQLQLREILKSHTMKLPGIQMDSDPKDNYSSCHVANDSCTHLQKRTPCLLILRLNSNIEPVVVAKGSVIPTSSNVTHCMPHNRDHVRVAIDKVKSEYRLTPLPVPSPECNLLGDVEGSFTQWPKSLVMIKQKETDLKRKLIKNNSKDIQKKMKEVEASEPALSNDESQGLSDLCIQLKKAFANDELVVFVLSKVAFGYEKDMTTYIEAKDVTDILTDKWLNNATLSVWIMCLHKRCLEKNVETIAFLCPALISDTYLSSKVENMKYMEDYVKDVMKASEEKLIILAPYFQDSHWMLLAICPTLSRVYVFDSLKRSRLLTIRDPLKRSFNLYKIHGGTKLESQLKWSAMICAQQPGGSEYGYYIMRYMLDIVDNYSVCTNLYKEYERREPFNKNELGEVKDLWAAYVLDKSKE